MIVQLHDKSFEAFIREKDILTAVEQVARKIEADYRDKNPLVIGVLDGCVLFMADLMREINFDFEIGFTKVASYEGTSSSGTVRELLATGRRIAEFYPPGHGHAVLRRGR